LGAAGLLHALFVAVRMGERDLGVLRVVGFTRRQVRSVLTWHASATVVAGTVVGVPIGIALGRWAWTSVAARLGVLGRSTVPLVDLLAVAVGALGLSLAVAAAFGQRAGRIP